MRRLLLFMVTISTMWSFAQDDHSADYSLEGLSKACLKYSEVWNFHNGLAIVNKVRFVDEELEQLYGVIDKEGNEIVPCTYNSISSYCEGRAVVKKNGKYGFINKQGQEIVPCIYDDVSCFSEGLAVVRRNKLYGYVDSVGKEVLPCVYSTAYDFSEGLACVYKPNGPNGYINKQGKIVLHQTGGPFTDGLAVKDDTKFMDKTGKIVFEVETDVHQCGEFSEGLAFVQKSLCFGYIDKNGHLVIPMTYCDAANFSEGLAKVENGKCGLETDLNSRIGYIDKKGDVVIPFIYKSGSSFNEGLAAVEKENGESIFIDKTGKQVFPRIFDDASGFSEGLAVVKKDWKWGYIDKQGRCTLDF